MSQDGTVRVVVKGKNIDVTPALKDYSLKRVAKLNKFFQGRADVRVDVLLSVERDTQIAEITYQLGGLLMRGESRTKDLYASIDEASDKIERQVRRYKARLKERLHLSPRLGHGLETELDGEAPAEEPEEALVVRTKRFPVKPMDVEEAILQMELLGHDFFVFENTESQQINVVYKRKDGKYGLIDPIVG